MMTDVSAAWWYWTLAISAVVACVFKGLANRNFGMDERSLCWQDLEWWIGCVTLVNDGFSMDLKKLFFSHLSRGKQVGRSL